MQDLVGQFGRLARWVTEEFVVVFSLPNIQDSLLQQGQEGAVMHCTI